MWPLEAARRVQRQSQRAVDWRDIALRAERRAKRAEDENVRLRQELEEANLRRIEAENPGIDISRVREGRRARTCIPHYPQF